MADTPPSKASEEMSPRQPGRKLERRNYAPSLDENRIDAAVVELFEKYSGISRAKIAEHSESIRDEAWNLFPYCCVGRFTFLDLSVRLAPEYPEVLSRVKAGEKYLDVGCCFGQDIRQLVYDGAPPQNVYGTDLEAGFFRLGHKLFKDRATLSSEFIAADMTSTEEKPLDHLEGTFSFIHASSFFHLFDWATQVQCAINCVRLLKPQSGSIIFGRHSATNEPKEIRHPERGTKLYRHSDVSWKKMWVQEVGPATGTKWRVEAAMIADTPLIQAADFGPAWMRMRYTCTME